MNILAAFGLILYFVLMGVLVLIGLVALVIIILVMAGALMPPMRHPADVEEEYWH